MLAGFAKSPYTWCMGRISTLFFWLARSSVGGFVVGWSFAHLSAWLPVDRLYETERVIAFYHPRPSYRVHVLIVPKRPLPTVLALTAADADIWTDVLTCVGRLVNQFDLEPAGYSLIVNGGARQDVNQLHWHLIAD